MSDEIEETLVLKGFAIGVIYHLPLDNPPDPESGFPVIEWQDLEDKILSWELLKPEQGRLQRDAH